MPDEKKKKQETTEEVAEDAVEEAAVVTSTATASGEVTDEVTETLVSADDVDVTGEATEATTEATTVSLEDLGANVNLGNPTWDLFLAGFFFVGALLYGWSLGKDRIITIMVSVYMALAVVAALPEFVLNVKVNENYTFQITAFIAVFVVLFFMLSRQAVLNSLSPGSDGKWWQTLLFSVLHVGLLVSVTMSFLPPQILANFSDLTLYLFTNQWTAFAWILAPILAMIFLGRSSEA